MTEIEEKLFKVACQKCDKIGVKFNENILNIYSLEDFLKLTEIICNQHPSLKLSDIVSTACRFHSKISFIKHMLTIYSNSESNDDYMYNILTSNNFYLIESDFEKLTLLNRVAKSGNIQEKSMLYYLSSKLSIATQSSVYDILSLVDSILTLEDEKQEIEIIIQIQEHPETISYYSAEQFAYIVKLYSEYPSVLTYFFDSRVTKNMTPIEAIKIFEKFSLITKKRIDEILQKIGICVFNEQKPFDKLMCEIQDDMEPNKPKEKAIHVFPYGIDQSGTWIDNLSKMYK